MAICICGGFMKVVGDKFVCECGKEKAIVTKVPSQAELWKEVQELRLIKEKYLRLVEGEDK